MEVTRGSMEEEEEVVESMSSNCNILAHEQTCCVRLHMLKVSASTVPAEAEDTAWSPAASSKDRSWAEVRAHNW